jgi:hypothetical protein
MPLMNTGPSCGSLLWDPQNLCVRLTAAPGAGSRTFTVRNRPPGARVILPSLCDLDTDIMHFGEPVAVAAI